eukprot:gene29062-35254_t
MSSKLNVAFVGCGNISRYHLAAALKCGRVNIAALVQALAADPDQELFSAIDIMVPSFVVDGADLHDSITKQALDSKRHILVEKPVTVEVETAVKLGEYKSAV